MEQALLARLQAGSEEAFTQLYRNYSGRMYANFLRMVKDEALAEEMVQDIFSRIWQKRETIQIEHDFAAYLYRTGANMVYDFYRKMQRDKALYAQFKAMAVENYTHIEEALHHKENEAVLQKALDTLSPQQKKVYQLCRLEGHSYREVALLLKISPLTVKEYMVNANRSLRAYLFNHLDTTIYLLTLWIISRD